MNTSVSFNYLSLDSKKQELAKEYLDGSYLPYCSLSKIEALDEIRKTIKWFQGAEALIFLLRDQYDIDTISYSLRTTKASSVIYIYLE